MSPAELTAQAEQAYRRGDHKLEYELLKQLQESPEELEIQAQEAYRRGDHKSEYEYLKKLQDLGAINEPGYMGAGIVEPAAAIASGLGTQIAGGLAGTAQALNPWAKEGAGAEMVKSVQSEAFHPKTKEGKENLKALGEGVQWVVDKFNVPMSGIGGIIELVSGQGLDQAVKTIENIQKEGISKTLGSRVYEETDSPLAATFAETAPTAIEMALGAPAASATKRAITQGVKRAAPAVTRIGDKAKEKLIPFKDDLIDIREKLGQQPESTLVEQTKKIDFNREMTEKLQEVKKTGWPDVQTAGFRLNKHGIAVKDNVEIKALKNGVSVDFVGLLKTAPRAAKDITHQMLSKHMQLRKNPALNIRPSDPLGQLFKKDFDVVWGLNKAAGQKLGKLVKSDKFKDMTVDVKDAVLKFDENLKKHGVQYELFKDKNNKITLKTNFDRVVLPQGDQNILKEVLRAMVIKSTKEVKDWTGATRVDFAKSVKAEAAHDMKKIIDRHITYGKQKEGLSYDGQQMLKEFRQGLNKAISAKSDSYKEVNYAFSKTAEIIDEVQATLPNRVDLQAANIEKALGDTFRTLASNNTNRQKYINMHESLASKAQEIKQSMEATTDIGKIIKSLPSPDANKVIDIHLLSKLETELARRWPKTGVAEKTFQGSVKEAGVQAAKEAAGLAYQAKTQPIQASLNVLQRLVGKITKEDDKAAFLAIKELLKR